MHCYTAHLHSKNRRNTACNVTTNHLDFSSIIAITFSTFSISLYLQWYSDGKVRGLRSRIFASLDCVCTPCSAVKTVQSKQVRYKSWEISRHCTDRYRGKNEKRYTFMRQYNEWHVEIFTSYCCCTDTLYFWSKFLTVYRYGIFTYIVCYAQ